MSPTARRFGVGTLCATALALGGGVAPARGEPGDPLFGPFYATVAKEGAAHSSYPPNGFEGPCGLAVDSGGNFYVSDYYHDVVDVFKPSLAYRFQVKKEDPLDGPCGLAVDTTGNLYVNTFHRDVVRYAPFASNIKGPGTVIDSARPTGVAVDPGTGNVYVDDRTYVAVYEPSGAPLEVGGKPLRIGEGSLGDGYGVAVSGFGETAGYVYVPDAADGTVKVYDPAVDTEDPVETIDGHETPEGRFVSLRDAAIAVDQASGLVYVADDLQPEYFERPEAAIYAFKATGAYAGRLKYNVVDARPAGLAVGKGRVYVTSGNSDDAYVLVYESGALTTSAFPPLGADVPDIGPPAPVTSAAAAPVEATAPAPGPVRSLPELSRFRHRHHARHRHHRAHRRGR